MRPEALPELGVGIVYSSGLEPLLAAHPDLMDVLKGGRADDVDSRPGTPTSPTWYGRTADIVALAGAEAVHSVRTRSRERRAHAAADSAAASRPWRGWARRGPAST